MLPTYLVDRSGMPRTHQKIVPGLGWATVKINETVSPLNQDFTNLDQPAHKGLCYVILVHSVSSRVATGLADHPCTGLIRVYEAIVAQLPRLPVT